MALVLDGVETLLKTGDVVVQFGADVRANANARGLVDAPPAAHFKADTSMFARRMTRMPLGRTADVKEIAGAAVFLASPAGAFVNGATLLIDGVALIGD